MSVLSDLFAAIAAAIREKNGESGTMKPADFPSKISAIPVGTGGNKDLVFATDQVSVTSTSAMTIEHGLGVVPDIVVVFVCGFQPNITLSTADGAYTGEIGFSSAAIAQGMQRKIYISNGSNVGPTIGVESEDSGLDTIGCVRKANVSTFTLGGSGPWPLKAGAYYHWVAIGNVV